MQNFADWLQDDMQQNETELFHAAAASAQSVTATKVFCYAILTGRMTSFALWTLSVAKHMLLRCCCTLFCFVLWCDVTHSAMHFSFGFVLSRPPAEML